MAKYIAAISGGPDSMAMLSMFKKNIALVCHVNYNKRPTARRDENIVINFCKKNHLKYEILNVTDSMYEEYSKINNNFQNVARLIRYDFFRKCAKKKNTNYVLVAHNKDDFLETALMQKKRDSISLFLGIKNKVVYKDIIIFRPLLNKWKSELTNYCNKNEIVFGVDETNDTDLYERNVMRKLISEFSPTKKNNEYKKIKKYNRRHAKKRRIVLNILNLWKYLSFSVNYFVNIEEKYKKYVIYLFLSMHDIPNINKNKIDLTIKWIDSPRKHTLLRLHDKIYLRKIDNFIKVVKN